MATSSSYSEDFGYVNIYGQDVRVYVCEKTGRLLIPIDELKNMGFRIYRKNQYSRLLIDDKQFVKEFDLFMLQSAQSYMLEHKIAFKENDILESINKCKLKLTGQQGDNNSSDFIKTHHIEGSPDSSLTITTPNLRQPSPATYENLINQNKFRGFTQNKNPASTLNSTDSFEKRPQAEQRNNFKSNHNNFTPRKSTSQQDLNDSFGQSPNSSFNGQEKKNTENSQELVERLPNIQFIKAQHTVVITFIERPNFAWVQDVDKVDAMLEICSKIQNEIDGNEKKVLSNNVIYNKIYLACDEGAWFRCKMIKFKPPTVFFVDYGNTAQTTDLREASDELSKIPAQAARISYIDSKYKPQVHETITIKIKKRFENGTYAVDFITDETSPVPTAPSRKVEIPAIQTFSIRPQSLGKLKHGQVVKIIAYSGSKLAVQTEECFAKLKQIKQALREEESRAKPVDKIEKGQLILYKDTSLNRAIVLNIKGSAIEIELLDTYEIVKTDLSCLRHINESLALQPLTFIWTPEFEMGDEAEEIIKGLTQQKAKATVVISDGHFDLKIGQELLSQKLKPQQLDRTLLKSLAAYKPPLGVEEYMLNVYCNKDELYFSHQETLDEYIQNVLITELDNDDPYEPTVDEVCLGLYEEYWSRCVVLSVRNQIYEVRFIDFGNADNLPSKLLRKLSDDAKEPPVLAFRCQLTGLPNIGRNIEDSLKEHITNATYEIKIKKFNGVAYEIEIPSVYAKL